MYELQLCSEGWGRGKPRQGLSAKTTDGFSTVIGPFFVSSPVNASSQGIEDTRTAKDVLAFFCCLSRSGGGGGGGEATSHTFS